MKITFEIKGAKELEQNLKTLPLRVEKNIIRKAVRAGQKPMQQSAKSNAAALPSKYPDAVDMSELLAKNIIIRVAKKQKKGSYAVNVMMRPKVGQFLWYPKGASSSLATKKTSGKRSYIPAAIEYGHMSGPTYVPPIPFMRPAAEMTINERIRILGEQLRTGLLREAIKGRT